MFDIMFRVSSFRSLPILMGGGISLSSAKSTSVAHSDAEAQEMAFSSKEFRSFPIRKVTTLSHNTKSFEVALPTPEHQMGMQTAAFVMVKGPVGEDGKFVARPYTPTSTNADKGFFELVIKTYPNGIVSNHIHSLKPGDKIQVKGPIQKFKYVPNSKKNISMIAGGTGITPMLQVVKEIINNPADKTVVRLIFANNTEEDILLKDEIDAIAKAHKSFTATYILSTPSPGWTGHKGFVTLSLVQEIIPNPSSDHLVLVCGPPGFMQVVSGGKSPDFKQGEVSGILKELGFDETTVFKF